MFDAIEADRNLNINLLVTNVGIASFQDDAEMLPELWRKNLSVNLDGTFNCVWHAKDSMGVANIELSEASGSWQSDHVTA